MRRTALALTCLLTTLSPTILRGDGENLPTPYSAEQIRDAWRQGHQIKTRITSAQGVVTTVTTVTEWYPEGLTLTDQSLDENGAPKGEATSGKVTWPGMRNNALFPAASTSRERAVRDTVLGKLEGWLYKVECGAGCNSEFFFADATPGPPVLYSKTQDGERQFLAEMIELHPATE